MATSRGATPADPVLAATTDDASRGGLFARSNIANPVSGVDVTGTSINDSTITLTLNYADSSETMTFMLNQANDQTLSFTVPSTTSSGGVSSNAVIAGGTYDTTTQMLTLTRRDSSDPVAIDLTQLVNQAELTAALNALVLGSTTFLGLTDTPATLGDENQILSVMGGALAFADAPAATVSVASFSSTDNTVETTANGLQVNLEAQPTWIGNANLGGVTGTVQATSITLDAATGFILRDNGSGSYTITTPQAPPAEASAPNVPEIPPSSAVSPSPEISEVVTAEGGTFANTGDVTATLTNPAGNPVMIPTPIIAGGGGSATVTIPAGDANAPGDYMLTVMTTTTSPDGMVRMDTVNRDVDRFIPFFQSRAPITDVTASGVVASDAAFSGSLTAIAGSSRLYFAVESSLLASTISQAQTNTGFPVFVASGDAVTVTLADGTTRTFNQFIAPVRAGTQLISFS